MSALQNSALSIMIRTLSKRRNPESRYGDPGFLGPSDRVRTCGLMVPNHARYQLRYTRKYSFTTRETRYSRLRRRRLVRPRQGR